MHQAFDDLRFEPEEIIDAGAGRVVVVNRAVGRGKGSGAKLDVYISNVWRLGDGTLESCITYDDHAEALQAVGLRE